MKWQTRALALAGLCVAGGFALKASLVAAPAIDDPLREALSGIDFVADKEHFDDLLGVQAAADLIAIARDVDDELDAGLRIRAYRALALYPDDTHLALLEAVEEHTSALVTGGVEVIFAKAAMQSLAVATRTQGAPEQALALGQLGNALEHQILDVRAAAARSLGKTELAGARSLLEARLALEQEELVRESIRRALNRLGGS